MAHPLITETDFMKLKQLITGKNYSDCANLGKEITKAAVVKDEDLEPGTVRINSLVEVVDLSSSKSMELKVVMPDEANLGRRWISVFAPISVALFGQKKDDIVTWQTREGTREFKIVKVTNHIF